MIMEEKLDALTAKYKLGSLALETKDRYQLALQFVETPSALHRRFATTERKSAAKTAR